MVTDLHADLASAPEVAAFEREAEVLARIHGQQTENETARKAARQRLQILQEEFGDAVIDAPQKASQIAREIEKTQSEITKLEAIEKALLQKASHQHEVVTHLREPMVGVKMTEGMRRLLPHIERLRETLATEGAMLDELGRRVVDPVGERELDWRKPWDEFCRRVATIVERGRHQGRNLPEIGW